MKKVLLAFGLLSFMGGNAQIFQENWDGNGPGMENWTLINNDNLSPFINVFKSNEAWKRLDRLGSTYVTEGNFAAMSTSMFNPEGVADRWIISPPIILAGTTPTLYWRAKSHVQGELAMGYKIMLSTNGGNTVSDFDVTLYSTDAEYEKQFISRQVDLTPYAGSTVRIAFVNQNDNGSAIMIDDIVVGEYDREHYCGKLAFKNVEPITNVTFAGIDRTSSELTTSEGHEFYLADVARVRAGESYEMSLQGNTGGNNKNRFNVYVDWNQDGDFVDEGEKYIASSTEFLQNSTGIDGKKLMKTIKVPADAVEGLTRMRIVKVYGVLTDYTDPCYGGSNYGQAEDYLVEVVEPLSTSDVKNEGMKIYPNPSDGRFVVDAGSGVTSLRAEVYDMSGKQIYKQDFRGSKADLNLTQYPKGVYILNLVDNNGKKQSAKLMIK